MRWCKNQLRIKSWLLMVFLMLFFAVDISVSASDVLGGGASFPNPLFQRMIEEYQFETQVNVSYNVMGSLDGYRALKMGEVDFSVSEIPQSVLVKSKNSDLVFFPVTMGAVSLVYNLPSRPVLKFTPAVIQSILTGEIRHWDDPKIQALNLSITLPNLPIRLIGRDEQSGTWFLFKAFLDRYGIKLKTLSDLMITVDSSEMVCESVSKNMGAVGVTEWHYAQEFDLPVAAVQNRSGEFVIPNLNSIRAAAIRSDEMLQLKELGLLDSSVSDAYPICGYSWVLTHRKQDDYRSFKSAQELVRWLSWMTHQGQLLAEENYYPALPYPLLKLIEKELAKITHSGIVLF